MGLVPVQIHMLNCGTLEPRGGRHLMGSAPWFGRGLLVSRCILIVQGTQMVLVDSGLGLVDIAVPWHRLGPLYLSAWRPALRASECAARQIEALGFERAEVRDIVLTHLDPNCAGGLGDFPNARVHVARAELEAATSVLPNFGGGTRYRSACDRAPRYRPARYRPAQWAHGVRWRTYQAFKSRWFDFAATEPLPELGLEVRLVELPGHSAGHAGVVVGATGGFLLHAGDASFARAELMGDEGAASPLRSAYESALAFDRGQRLLTLARLRHLLRNHRREVAIVCSHDPNTPDLAAILPGAHAPT